MMDDLCLRQTGRHFWYHISCVNLGNTVTLKPRSNFPRNEPEWARVCVGPSVAHCAAAIHIMPRMFVYRTVEPLLAYRPYNVCDSFITKEKWLFKPTIFEKVIILREFNDFPEDCDIKRGNNSYAHLSQQKKDLSKIIRFFKINGYDKKYPNIRFF